MKKSGPPDKLRIPYELLEPVGPARQAALQEAAYCANDRYVVDFVEEFSFCPYARKGRRDGLTYRYFHYASADSPEAEADWLVDLLTEVAQDPAQAVVQVVMPLIEVEPNAWHVFCQDLVAFTNARLPRSDHMATAALHPGLPFYETSPFALIPLFRRSPDPTIQWVRMDAIKALYAGRESGTRFLTLDEVSAYLDGARRAKPLYDRIAETNEKMASRLKTDHIVRTLAGIADDAQRTYEEVLLDERYD